MTPYTKILYLVFLFYSCICNAIPAINITFLSDPQNICSILDLQRHIVMSKAPKELSQHPRATCFKVNINEFLPIQDKAPQPVYGCIFSDQVAMNAALLRAGLFVHTNVGTATDEQVFNSKLMTTVGGHDFSGSQLTNYFQNTSIPVASSKEHKQYKAIENEFNTKVMRPIIDKNKNNFVFFGIINTKKFKENLSHELLHAQYYDVPQIKEVLQQVWETVPSKDQNTIIDCLRNGGYDMEQHDLLLREFYSYFLQYNANEYLEDIKVLKPMAPLAKLYGPKICNALAAHKIKVLKVTR